MFLKNIKKRFSKDQIISAALFSWTDMGGKKSLQIPPVSRVFAFPPQSGTARGERSEPERRHPSHHPVAARGGGEGQGRCRFCSSRRQGGDEQNRQKEVETVDVCLIL